MMYSCITYLFQISLWAWGGLLLKLAEQLLVLRRVYKVVQWKPA